MKNSCLWLWLTCAALALEPALEASERLEISGSIPPLGQGQDMSWTPTYAGGTPPYRFDIEKGSLPGGLRLDASTGRIHGAPTSLGQSDFTLRIRDERNESALLDLRTIVNLPLLFSDISFPSVIYTQANYSWPLQPSGGIPPYTFTLASGKLPDGFAIINDPLNPSLGGYLYQGGSSTNDIVIRLTDAFGVVMDRRFQLNIVDGLTVSPRNIEWSGEQDDTKFTVLVNSARQSQEARIYSLNVENWPVFSARSFALPGRVVVERGPLPASNICGYDNVLVDVTAAPDTRSINASWNLFERPSCFGPTILVGESLYREAPQATAQSLTVSHSTLELHALRGEPSLTASVVLRPNSAGIAYAVLSTQTWAIVDKPFGTLDTDQPLVITLYPKDLSVGVHHATITFFDATGTAQAHTDILLRVAENSIPLRLSRHSLQWTGSDAAQTVVLRNPNATSARFESRSESPVFVASPSSGILPPRSEAIITLTARPDAPATAVHSHLVLAMNHTQLELIDLTYKPADANCAMRPPQVHAPHPGQHATIAPHGSVRFQLLVRDGCGKPISTGSLTLQTADKTSVPLFQQPNGEWLGSWRDLSGRIRSFQFKALWSDLTAARSASETIQVNVQP